MGSRAGLIALLIAVEVAIVAIAIYAIGHAAWGGVAVHRFDYTAKPIAPIAAGSAPLVAVDDSEDRVVVTASTDNLVHVTDRKSFHGTTWGTSQIAPLIVKRTSGGVSIARDTDGDRMTFNIFGSGSEVGRIDVAVPAGSTLDIEGSAGADVTGIDGAVTVRSQDGRIALTTLRGAVDAQTDDGEIRAHDVIAPTFSAISDDGSIVVDALHVTGSSAKLHSDDGSITVGAEFAGAGAYEVSSDDGHIELTLAPGANLTVNASSNDGRVMRDGQAVGGGDDDDNSSGAFKLGSGAGRLDVSSDDGSVSITTNGAI